MIDLIKEDEAKQIVEESFGNTLEDISKLNPTYHKYITGVLEKIKYTNPDKAKGRIDFVLKPGLYEERLCMPAEIHGLIYTIKKLEAHSFIRSTYKNIFFSGMMGYFSSLVDSANHPYSKYLLMATTGLFTLRAGVSFGRFLRSVAERSSNPVFNRPLDDVEARLADYVFKDDRDLEDKVK